MAPALEPGQADPAFIFELCFGFSQKNVLRFVEDERREIAFLGPNADHLAAEAVKVGFPHGRAQHHPPLAHSVDREPAGRSDLREVHQLGLPVKLVGRTGSARRTGSGAGAYIPP